jgi:hypothetical protein
MITACPRCQAPLALLPFSHFLYCPACPNIQINFKERFWCYWSPSGDFYEVITNKYAITKDNIDLPDEYEVYFETKLGTKKLKLNLSNAPILYLLSSSQIDDLIDSHIIFS